MIAHVVPQVSELGAVYQESRAFRTLLFVDDEDGSARDSRFVVLVVVSADLAAANVAASLSVTKLSAVPFGS